MKNIIIIIQGLTFLFCTNSYATNYTWWCDANTTGGECQNFITDTKLEPLDTNHYIICCGSEGGTCNQPSGVSLHSLSDNLAVDNVGYCGQSASDGGVQFSVTNINPFGGNDGFDITSVVCDGGGMTLNHDGFSDTSVWYDQADSGDICIGM